MNSHLLPNDAGWHTDKALITELTPIIAQLSKYVMRYLDADAGRAEPISADDEHALGLKLTGLGDALQRRAAQREAPTNNHGPTVEGEAVQPRALEPGRQPDMDNSP